MTDRLNALTVLLEHNLRDDDAEGLINAIRHLRGVSDVVGVVADPAAYSARRQGEKDIRRKVYAALEIT